MQLLGNGTFENSVNSLISQKFFKVVNCMSDSPQKMKYELFLIRISVCNHRARYKSFTFERLFRV